MLTISKMDRLEKFIESLKCDIYTETDEMNGFIDEGIESIKTRITPGCKVLDVGCGQCHALELFTQHGAEPIGITLNEEERQGGKAKGHDVRIMDMSFLEFDDNTFDIVWARHSIEHSPFPLFTLSELYRVLRPEGLIYLELPATDTKNNHEFNRNHYSVFGSRMWQSLLTKVGFKFIGMFNIELKSANGNNDVYYRIWTEK